MEGRVDFIGVCPANARLLRGGGDCTVVVVGGDTGTSSIINDGASNVTELPRCDLDLLDLCGAGSGGRPDIFIDLGAPSRRCDNGTMFSSSAIEGSFWLAHKALDDGEVMLALVRGDMMGDLAGLQGGQHFVRGLKPDHLIAIPVVMTVVEQLLQLGDALMQLDLLRTPDLPLCTKRLVEQLDRMGLLIHNDLQA